MQFGIEEALKFGWQKTKEHSRVLFLGILTLFGLSVAQAVVSTVLQDQLIGFFGTLAIVIVEVIAGVGFTLITLKIAKGEHVEYADIIPPMKLVWQYLAASLLAGLMAMLGFILLIVPGIYLALRFSMVRFAALEGKGIMGSIERSGVLTAGIKWKLLGFFIVCGLLNIAGAILLMVGLLVTVPVTMIAYAHVYNKLSAHHTHA